MISIGVFCFFRSLTPRMRSRWSYLVSCLILSSFLLGGAEACWGTTAPNYGDMSPDYDLTVGADLVLNCTLKKRNFPDLPRTINSSDLVIERGNQDFSKFTRVIDDYTVQLKHPNANVNDTGVYICKIFLSNDNKPVVCGSKVNVGYPPHHITNFTCISRNFDNLNCSWGSEDNNVLTKYSIVKYLYNEPGLAQPCPNSTAKSNSCVWSSNTDPPFNPFFRNLSFTITGNNSLGRSTDYFRLDGFSVVIPNSPETLEVLQIGSQFVTVGWKPPTMRNFAFGFPPLKYQIWISSNSSDALVYDMGNQTSSYTIRNLIPFIRYNISIRCRSSFTESDDMWSTFANMEIKTLADVPYNPPEVISEAFELHMFEEFRSADLYWKAVPPMHHNGDKFHYHIKYFEDAVAIATSEIRVVNSSKSYISVKHLLKNSSYAFHVYSANEKGISKKYGLISIESANKIPPAPRDVRVISQDIGQYNLSWYPPNDEDSLNYTVFWCSSLKPWLTRCDNSIMWIDENLSDTNIVLNVSDIKTNFQFAVVSKTETSSSGMQWASCIVPHKGGLSKIKYVVVEQKNSNALKVIWNLDCPAEKAVVKRYEITYCGINKRTGCNVAEVEGNADSFVLRNLRPYSNYSVKIRAINSENKASEDSDAVFQSTLPGAPSGPPQNVQILSNSKDSFTISWTPPLEPNGIITTYAISYNGSKEYLVDVTPMQNEYSLKVHGLKPYTMYDVQIQACVKNHCSVKSEPVLIQTEVDDPGFMEPPRIEEVNSTHFKISWTTPVSPNGPVDFYIIKWHPERHNASSSVENMLEVEGSNSVVLDVKCPSLEDEALKYFFYVQAVNKKNGTNLFGPLSESTQAKACLMAKGKGRGMFVGTIVGAAFGAMFFLFFIYRFTQWIRLKIHQVKSITIRLPEGLEGPEANPLNNYECFKNGLNGNLQTTNSERLSYVIDENKNRHGSGSSQFSNSSAEELIFKNGKCTKFGRKPSGDSSGCSSMSSNATPRIHLSSDSGTESDFVIPPSPDSAVTEPNFHNSHKTPLPILMEVHDQPSSLDNEYNYKIATGDMILKVEPPYSKFGYASNPTSPSAWRMNPLVFYSCNLANSEPSVFDTQKPLKTGAIMGPYSKVGLAKSSGDIGMTCSKQMGYSKFGYPISQKRFSIPPPNINSAVMVMLENPDKKEWPNIKKMFTDNYSHAKIKKDTNISMPCNNLVEDTGYIKVGKICPSKSNNGYVPFNDLRNQMDHNNSFVFDNPVGKTKNMYSSTFNDKDQTEFPDEADWPVLDHCEEENRNEETAEILFDVPFSTNNCTPLVGGDFIANNGSLRLSDSENSNDSLPKLPPESDKYSSDSPTLSFSEVNFDNSPSAQNHIDCFLRDEIKPPNRNATFEESRQSNKNDTYAIPNEVIVSPMTLRNNYVPFNALSDSLCDRTHMPLPNASDLSIPRTSLSNGVCTEIDNYITPTHKGDLRLLKDNCVPKTVPIMSPSTNSLNGSEKCAQNGNGYANLSLKYVLKPLPKMESEVCEV